MNVKKHCVWLTHIACLFHKCHWILILGLWVMNIVIDLETNIWLSVSVCLCVYEFCMCLYVCSMSVAVLRYSLFFETRSLSCWTWYSPTQLDQQTNKSQGPPVTISLEPGLWMRITESAFMWLWGISLCLCAQHFTSCSTWKPSWYLL